MQAIHFAPPDISFSTYAQTSKKYIVLGKEIANTGFIFLRAVHHFSITRKTYIRWRKIPNELSAVKKLRAFKKQSTLQWC
jgi:hypothetical protein